jgi:hypothetical protein
VWESQRHPTPSSVARALGQAGRKVSSKTIARWHAGGWQGGRTGRPPLDIAEDALDAALPALTGDPTTSVRSILNMRETARMAEGLSGDQLLRLRTRALRTMVIVLNLELARRADELIPERMEEFTRLLEAVMFAFEATVSADEPCVLPQA